MNNIVEKKRTCILLSVLEKCKQTVYCVTLPPGYAYVYNNVKSIVRKIIVAQQRDALAAPDTFE